MYYDIILTDTKSVGNEVGEKMNKRPRSKLIKLRIEKGFTQEQMALLLKVTRATYANWETGYRNPSFSKVVEMKKILNVSEDKYFSPDNDTKSV